MSFADKLTEAAKITARLVKSMTWFERHSPNAKRIKYHFEELERCLEAYKNKDHQMSHLDHIRYLHSLVLTVRSNSLNLEKELYVRTLVLDALENVPEEED